MSLPIRSLAVLLFIISGGAQAASPFVAGEYIVQLKSDVRASSKAFARSGFQVVRELVPGLSIYLIRSEGKNGLAPQAQVKNLRQMKEVQSAQLNHRVSLRNQVTPNDPEIEKQWAFGQENGVDIQAREAWSLLVDPVKQGSDLVVAVVDGGLDVKHKDIEENVWVNAQEIPENGIDDDENGYIDDVYGWNAYKQNGTISSNYHGTHVAGTVSAKTNNGVQVAGVNWNVKVMPILGASGDTATVLEAYGYALVQKKRWIESSGKVGANVVATNSSFGVDYAKCESGEYPMWNTIYDEMGKVGILSAAATANNPVNVDVKGDVPTSCSSPYIVAVTNTTSQDKLASAGYGAKAIDLGAPGTDILSTVPGNKTAKLTGTSMATPHVAGAIAFMHSVASADFLGQNSSNPAEAALVLKGLLVESVDVIPALEKVTVSGGRLNLFKAVQAIREWKGSARAR